MTDQSTPTQGGSRLPRRTASRVVPPSVAARIEVRSQRVLLLALRLLYMVLLVTVTLLPFVGAITETAEEFSFVDYLGPIVATFAFGVLILVVDAATPNKRLATVVGVYLGIIAGLVGALAIGALLDLIAESWDLTDNQWLAYRYLVKLAIGITMCYLAVSIVLTTKDNFRLVIPYVEFAKQVRGVRPLLLDTSVLIDGRIDGLGQTGFLDAPLLVPNFVIDELQALSDSGDKLKRARGRRGLAMVNTLQSHPQVDVSIDDAQVAGHSVDHKLIQLAADQNLRILTTDYNLEKIGQIQDVAVLNLNDLAGILKPQAIPGETLEVEVVKIGESAQQGVGYMPDGTMVVIEGAADRVGQTVSLIVTNSLQTSAGRMIFGRVTGVRDGEGRVEEAPESAPMAEQMAKSATAQPRQTNRPERERQSSPRRNPRR